MTEEQLKKWFWDKFNLCYTVRHEDYPDTIFLYYDESYIRKIKLCKINNQETISPTKINGTCLFAMNFKYNKMYCSYAEIWKHLNINYSYNNYSVQALIKGWLNENDKLNVLIPSYTYDFLTNSGLEEIDKLTII